MNHVRNDFVFSFQSSTYIITSFNELYYDYSALLLKIESNIQQLTMEKNSTDIKTFNLHKSHTFTSFTHSSSHKISSWFTALSERRKKSAMKTNKNVTLGK